MNDLNAQLREIVGENGVIDGPDLADRAISYWDSAPTRALGYSRRFLVTAPGLSVRCQLADQVDD